MTGPEIAVDASSAAARATATRTPGEPGLAGGWRDLSPNWRGMWGGDTPASLPPACTGIARPCSFGVGDYIATGVINSRLPSFSIAAKDEGIIICTIALQGNDSAAQNIHRPCAFRAKSFSLSPTSSDRAVIFQTIATQLTNLRLAQ